MPCTYRLIPDMGPLGPPIAGTPQEWQNLTRETSAKVGTGRTQIRARAVTMYQVWSSEPGNDLKVWPQQWFRGTLGSGRLEIMESSSSRHSPSALLAWVSRLEHCVQLLQSATFGLHEEEVDKGALNQIPEYEKDVAIYS